MKADYSYQKRLLKDVKKYLPEFEKVVLAAAPGAGKTHMSIELCDWYLKEHPKARILVLTHSQTILRDQWSEVFAAEKPNLPVHTVLHWQELPKQTSTILLALPQTFIRCPAEEIPVIDLLIVDEAHHNYHGSMIKRLLAIIKPKHQLLVTGTPSGYIGRDSVKIVGISLEEMMKAHTVVDPIIEIIESGYLQDFNDLNTKIGELKTQVSESETHKTLEMLLGKITEKLISKNRENPKLFEWAGQPNLNWKTASQKLRKTMIVCRSIKQAEMVNEYLRKQQVVTRLCTSGFTTNGFGNAKKSTQDVHDFKTNTTVSVLIVVRRGVLGFNYEDLMNVIDMTCSFNVNRLFQVLCRVIRRPQVYNGEPKLFLKLTPPKLSMLTYVVMSYVVALSTKEHYYSYSAAYSIDKLKHRRKKIPVTKEYVETLMSWDQTALMGRGNIVMPKLLTFEDVINQKSKQRLIAYTDFATVQKKLFGKKMEYNLDDVMAVIGECKTRQDFARKYPHLYAYILRSHQTHVLTKIYGPIFRYDEENIKIMANEYKSLRQLREAKPGIYGWIKKHKRFDLINRFKAPTSTKSTSRSTLAIHKAMSDEHLNITRDGQVFYKRERRTVQMKHGTPYIKLYNIPLSLCRLMYTKFNGPIPSGKLVALVNKKLPISPENLMVTNIKDINRRPDRKKGTRGHNAFHAKMSMDKASEMRALKKSGKSLNQLAEKFGVSKSTASYICAGKIWKA